MYKILITTIFFVGFSLSSFAEPSWLKKGEVLRYKIYLTFIKAGEAELIYTPQQNNTYTLQSNARTTSGVKSFFNLKDKITVNGIHLPQQGFLPIKYDLKLRENDYRADKNVVYNRANREVIYTNVWGKQKPRSFSVSSNTRDMISALYFLRSTKANAKVGDIFSLPVFDLDKPYLMDVKILSRETIEINDREVSVFHIKPVLNGVSDKRTSDKLHIWATDDGNFTPVKIKIDMKVGSFKAVLNSRKIDGKNIPIGKEIKYSFDTGY